MKRKIASLVLVLIFATAAVCLAAEKAPMAAPDAPEKKFGMAVGDQIKPVSIKRVVGDEPVSTGGLPNRSIFLLVSSVCTACRLELKDINDNMKEFKGKADIYAVIIDVDPAVAVERIKAQAPDLVLLTDPEYVLGGSVQMATAPSTLILDKDGKILYRKAGYEPNQWKEYARLLNKK